MPIVGLSPTWWTKKQSVGNLPTCDTLWSSKSVMFFTVMGSGVGTDREFHDNPAYIPFANDDILEAFGNNVWSNDSTSPSGFTHWLVPSIYKKNATFVTINTMDTEINVYLGRDGPTRDGVWSGTPVKEKLLFKILNKTSDPLYNPKLFYDGPAVQMHSGHSWGLIVELVDEPASFPTTNKELSLQMTNVIYFGGAGN